MFQACGQDVIQTAKADVIGPAIAADDPMGGRHQKILPWRATLKMTNGGIYRDLCGFIGYIMGIYRNLLWFIGIYRDL